MSAATTRLRLLGRALLLFTAATLAACRDASTASTDGTSAVSARAVSNSSSLSVTVGGLPTGTAAAVTVTGPNGFSRAVTGTTTITGLANGSYTVTARAVTVGTAGYAATPATQTVSLRKGSTGRATVTYAVAPTTGGITVTVSMPDATPAAVTVTGPNAYTRALTATTTLADLAPGSYTITATQVSSATTIFTPAPATQALNVTAGATASAAVAYTATGVVPGASFNMQVLGMTLTQSVQTITNSVTQVTGRPAMLRVFAVANGANSAKPAVRVRVYANGALVSTLTATNAGTSVPQALDNGNALASWNVALPGTLVQPGLAILADVDPANAIPESNETDNSYPLSGTPQSFTVRAVPTLAMKFVPITQSSTLGTGAVSATNAETFLRDTRDLLPVNTINATVREAYTTSNTLLSDGTGWGPTLSEIYALRSADQSGEHYYGVVKVGYGSGVAGMGYIGAPASIGWDYLPSGSNVMAHELGHNFGRQHAPCGGVAGPDPSYPYAGGVIGQVGYNVRTNTLMAASMADIMGYCSPKWISDYNYTAIMNYRGFATGATAATVSGAVATNGVLVWGRVEPDGTVVLEPAIRITAPSVLPAQNGEYSISGRDASGAQLFSASFTPVALAQEESAPGGAHFAFVLPIDSASYARLARVSVSGRGRSAERVSRSNAAAMTAARPDVASEGSDRARVKWNAAEYPMAVVRDATSGRILSFARGGNSAFASSRADVEVILTDGVRSVSNRMRVRGR